MIYSVKISRNFRRRKCCKEIAENSQDVVRPHREVLISVVFASVGQPSWIGAPLKIFKSTLSRGVAFQLSISLTVVSSTCKISWKIKLHHKQLNSGRLICDCARTLSQTCATQFEAKQQYRFIDRASSTAINYAQIPCVCKLMSSASLHILFFNYS